MVSKIIVHVAQVRRQFLVDHRAGDVPQRNDYVTRRVQYTPQFQ
jgi:hypothetical protein